MLYFIHKKFHLKRAKPFFPNIKSLKAKKYFSESFLVPVFKL